MWIYFNCRICGDEIGLEADQDGHLFPDEITDGDEYSVWCSNCGILKLTVRIYTEKIE